MSGLFADRRADAVAQAFATYARRRLDDPTGGRVALLRAGSLPPTESPSVALVAPPPGLLRRHRLEHRSGLSSRLSGGVTGAGGAPLPFALFDGWDPAALGAPPPGFDVLAVLTTYNEEEIIEQQLDRLLGGGIRVHVVDNWSTDGTYSVLERYAKHDEVTLERFPAAGPAPYFELEVLLGRVEEVAHRSGADWVVHHDTDEIREPPWPGLGLRAALWAVEGYGYNCIDHTILQFRPVDDSWRPGADLAAAFAYFEFGESPGHFVQLKAWKPQRETVKMAGSGGHEALFPDRRVFPYKFLIRHYPIRSQSHGERKILQERQLRWSPTERARGWHTHYDQYGEGSSFVWDAERLYDFADLDRRYLLERLSGVGLAGNPFVGERVAEEDELPPRGGG